MKRVLALLLFGFGWTFAQTLVADGLNNPQGVLVAPDGSVWVTDAGTGGDEGAVSSLSARTGEALTGAYGRSARVVRIGDGVETVVATLPSVVVGQETAGGARLAFVDNTLYATTGFWIINAGPEAPGLLGTVVKIEGNTVSEVADLWTFERDENPDGFIEESHPYGLLPGPDGSLWVTDAGGNTLLNVDPESGETTVVATFSGVPGPLPNPARGGAMESDPVPTAVAMGDDGNLYVSFLSGFPFLPGSAKVVRVAPDGAVSDYTTGLTSLTDLRRGPDGNLYAVQFAEFGAQGPAPRSGALVRIGEGGASERVLEGLMFPTSVDFDARGNAYLAIGGVGAPGSGQVVMYEGVAAP